MQDLIAIAKAKPGQLNHGSVGSGSMGSLAAELLRTLAGIQFTQVTYKGSPQALTALISGEIDFYLIGSAGTVVPHVKAGRIRALGVGAKQRIAALPDVPPIAETVPGYEARGWNGILAPAGTPKPIVDRLHSEIVKIVRSPEFAQVLTRRRRDGGRQHAGRVRRDHSRRHREVGEDHQGKRNTRANVGTHALHRAKTASCTTRSTITPTRGASRTAVLFVHGFTENTRSVAAVGAAFLAPLPRGAHRPARVRKVGRGAEGLSAHDRASTSTISRK